MRGLLRRLYGHLKRFGFDPIAGIRNLRGMRRYASDLRAFRRAEASSDLRARWPLGDKLPCLIDRYEQSGTASGHYFHQDLLVARRVFARAPKMHIDVGSRFDGFIAHVASFRPIRVLDIRDMPGAVPNVTFGRCDLMAALPANFEASCDSLSCLHALEHFGLGRYGDPIRPDGHEVALANLARIVAPGGWFYLSVPIGPQRIEFNAHRVFAVRHLLELLSPYFEVRALAFVDDRGDLHESIDLEDSARIDANFSCRYGCAIVEAVRLADGCFSAPTGPGV